MLWSLESAYGRRNTRACEGGMPATPGGRAASADGGVFARSGDAAPSCQGNLAGANTAYSLEGLKS